MDLTIRGDLWVSRQPRAEPSAASLPRLARRIRCCALVLAWAGGCGEAQPEPAEPALPEIETGEVPREDLPREMSPLEARRDYLTRWSRCLLRTGARLEQSWARLEQDIDVDKARVRHKGLVPFFDAVDGELLDACPLGTQTPAEVSAELATQGRAYVLATRGYGNRAKELQQHFDPQGDLTDIREQLRSDLPELKATYDTAHQASRAFAARLEAAQDAADALWLEEHGNAGQAQSAAWHVINTAMKGRAASACVTRERPLPDACRAASEAFTVARGGLEQWRETHAAEAVGVFWLEVFRKRADALEQATARLRAPVSRRKKTAELELATAAQRVADARDALQTAANTVVFDFP